MIICSCSVITEAKIKECLTKKEKKPSVSTVLKELNAPPMCGTCVDTVVKIIKEHYEK